MRIVHVSDCFAPRTGGIETQVGDLARHQARAGHEVHVLTATLGDGGERGGQGQPGEVGHGTSSEVSTRAVAGCTHGAARA